MANEDSTVTGAPSHEGDEATQDVAPGPARTPGGAGPLPDKLGRYHVLAQLGAGGMGVVLSAYDPDLDRKVALKLLRAQGNAGSAGRMLREAHALARLSHPNVVQIHDTGAIDGQIFIAMELVRGVDLRTWLARPRPPAEVLRAFLDAGRGLAAAHDAGFVHRDFKPENVLLGEDGRARVADFGLVRLHDEQPDEPVTAPSTRGALGHSLTLTGARLGTPGYMSPEQHLGLTADARSDQFSYCVALWEALHGQRPFTGDSPEAIVAAVRSGRLRAPPRGSRGPAERTRLLQRGLAYDPEQRHPSMHALLAALTVDPARRRRRWLFGLAGAGLLAAIAGAWLGGEAEPCAGGPEALAATWNPPRRQAVADALTSTSDPALPRFVLAGLDAYAGEWLTAHRDACLDHHRGEQSSALLDARMHCLDRRRQTLAAATRLLVGEAGLSDAEAGPPDAAQLVARMPAISACADPAVVLSEAAVPEDPALAGEVAAVASLLISARVRHDAGDLAGALVIADDAVAQARRAQFRPILAEALLVQARIHFTPKRWELARPALDEALVQAVEARRDDLAAEAMARLLYVDGVHRGRTAEALRLAPLALAMAARAPEPHAARGLAHNNIGAAQMLAHDREGALLSMERGAEEMLAAPHADPIELAHVLLNVAHLTAEPEQRHAGLNRAKALLVERLGPRHLVTLEARRFVAKFEPELRVAEAQLAEACPEYLRDHGGTTTTCAFCFRALVHMQMFRGETARALASAEQGLACRARPFTEQDGSLRAKAQAFIAVHSGRPLVALERIKQARVWPDSLQGVTWIGEELAELELIRGRALLLLGRHVEAAEALQQALPGFATAVADRYEVLTPLLLAETQTLLARALLAASPPDRERAAQLTAAAQASFAAQGAVAP